MDILLLAVSMTSTVVHTVLMNHAGKSLLTDKRKIWLFNTLMFAVCFIILLAAAVGSAVSLFTVLFGLLFGIVTIIQSHTKLLAFARGPMHITQLITTASLIIPSLSGIFIDKVMPSPLKLVLIVVLLGFIYLSLDMDGNTSFKRGWLFVTLVSFTCQAAIGIMQKLHQSSAHASESAWFLVSAFLCSAVFSVVMLCKNRGTAVKTERSISIKILVSSALCGVCVFVMNFLNLRLSGTMPSHIFFPLVNGGVLFLNLLTSLIIFREKLTLRQGVGVFGGFVTLLLICIV